MFAKLPQPKTDHTGRDCVCAKLRRHKTNLTEHHHDSTKTGCFRYFQRHFRPPKSERRLILGHTENPENQKSERSLILGNTENPENQNPIQWPLQALDGLVLDPAPKYITTAISVLFQADSGMLVKK